jgi:UDPglucose 6-dehydrogenase
LNDYQVQRVVKAIETRLTGDGAVGVLGLSYKPETSVIERSQGVAVLQQLLERGVDVVAYDPKALTGAQQAIERPFRTAPSAEACVRAASAVVVMTPWPEFRAIPAEAFARSRRMTVIDCWRVLSREEIGAVADLVYPGVGAGDAVASVV